MDAVKKMALIPSSTLARLQVQQQLDAGPVLNRFSTLDTEMQKILSDGSLPDDVKVGYYNNALRRYESMKTQESKPIEIDFPKAEKELKLPEADVDIIGRLPNNLKNKGRLLLKYLTENPDVEWNEKREMIHRGRLIPNSNFYDLFNDLAKSYKSDRQQPIGFQQLAESLHRANIPKDAISHTARWNQIINPVQRRLQFPDDDQPGPSTSPRSPPRTPPTVREPRNRQPRVQYTPYQRSRGRRNYVNSNRRRAGWQTLNG